MKEIEKNKEAWSLLSKEHYEHYKKLLEKNEVKLIKNIVDELGDVSNKGLIHLQCNVGVDTILLKRLGLKSALGVDLSEENMKYANQLVKDFEISNLSFIQSDVLELDNLNLGKFDIVFTSEGVLGWLPDLDKWAKNVRSLLKEDGFFYIYDSHPFMHIFDEDKISQGEFNHLYDYFSKTPDQSFEIGGYASKEKIAENYFWNHSISTIINSLINAGLKIEFFHEFDYLFWNAGNMEKIDNGMYRPKNYKDRFPFSYSIKASLK